MAGIDENEDAATFGDRLSGDAQFSVNDFARPAINISLTNIQGSLGKQYNDLIWNEMALEDGAFADDIDDITGSALSDPLAIELGGGQPPPPGALIPGQISGRFYGPNHEEVGGIFWRDQISGAFIGKRN